MTPTEKAMVDALESIWGKFDGPDGWSDIDALMVMAGVADELVAFERERCARLAEAATTGLTGFVESDRMEFAVKNMAKLRDVIARRIREGK